VIIIFRCERTKGPLASSGSGRAARPGSSPVGAEFPGAHRGGFLSPEGYRGACGVWCVCVCKSQQTRPRISRQPIYVERAVNVGVQLSSYMIFQYSCRRRSGVPPVVEATHSPPRFDSQSRIAIARAWHQGLSLEGYRGACV